MAFVPLLSGLDSPFLVRVLGQELAAHEVEGLSVSLDSVAKPSSFPGRLSIVLAFLELPGVHPALCTTVERVSRRSPEDVA